MHRTISTTYYLAAFLDTAYISYSTNTGFSISTHQEDLVLVRVHRLETRFAVAPLDAWVYKDGYAFYDGSETKSFKILLVKVWICCSNTPIDQVRKRAEAIFDCTRLRDMRTDTTHLVMARIKATEKLLSALILNATIVSLGWLDQMAKLFESQSIVVDPGRNLNRENMDPTLGHLHIRWESVPLRRQLFKDCLFVVPDHSFEKAERLIGLGGGQVRCYSNVKTNGVIHSGPLFLVDCQLDFEQHHQPSVGMIRFGDIGRAILVSPTPHLPNGIGRSSPMSVETVSLIQHSQRGMYRFKVVQTDQVRVSCPLAVQGDPSSFVGLQQESTFSKELEE